MFFEKSEKIFRGFFKRRKPQKGGLGVATPTRFPQDKIERLAKFGTVVESCSKKLRSVVCSSKKLRSVVCSLTIQLYGATLLRSSENFLRYFFAVLHGQVVILSTLRLNFLRKLPLNSYNTALCDFAKDFIKS